MGTGKKMAMLKANMAQDIKLREIREYQYEVRIRNLRDELAAQRWKLRRTFVLAAVLLGAVGWLLVSVI